MMPPTKPRRRAASGEKTLLIHFLSDLLRKRSLQTRSTRGEFADVMREYGLSSAQVAAVLSRSRSKIGAALTKELAEQAVGFPSGARTTGGVVAAGPSPQWPPGSRKPKRRRPARRRTPR